MFQKVQNLSPPLEPKQSLQYICSNSNSVGYECGKKFKAPLRMARLLLEGEVRFKRELNLSHDFTFRDFFHGSKSAASDPMVLIKVEERLTNLFFDECARRHYGCRGFNFSSSSSLFHRSPAVLGRIMTAFYSTVYSQQSSKFSKRHLVGVVCPDEALSRSRDGPSQLPVINIFKEDDEDDDDRKSAWLDIPPRSSGMLSSNIASSSNQGVTVTKQYTTFWDLHIAIGLLKGLTGPTDSKDEHDYKQRNWWITYVHHISEKNVDVS